MNEITEPADMQTEDRIPYLPSPEEIRAMCELIRAEWSPEEEYSRRVVKTPSAGVRRVTVAEYDD